MRMRAMVLGTAMFAAAGPALVQAQKVTTDFDHKADFGSFKTFSFIKVQTSNPLNVARVQDGITRELTKHGMEMVQTGGDLQIAAVGSTKDQTEYNTFYNNLGGGGWGTGGWGRGGWGGWGGGGGGVGQSTTTAEQVPVGTLRVDLYSQGTHQLVWRGIASDQLSTKAEKNVKKLDKALDKMFDKYPPKANA